MGEAMIFLFCLITLFLVTILEIPYERIYFLDECHYLLNIFVLLCYRHRMWSASYNTCLPMMPATFTSGLASLIRRRRQPKVPYSMA